MGETHSKDQPKNVILGAVANSFSMDQNAGQFQEEDWRTLFGALNGRADQSGVSDDNSAAKRKATDSAEQQKGDETQQGGGSDEPKEQSEQQPQHADGDNDDDDRQTKDEQLRKLVDTLKARLDENVSVVHHLRGKVNALEQKQTMQKDYIVQLEREHIANIGKLERELELQKSSANKENEKVNNRIKDLVGDVQETCERFGGIVDSVDFLKGLIPYNRWDSNACHKDLTLSGPELLCVQHDGAESGHRTVFAKWPVTKNQFNSFYFEIKIDTKLSSRRSDDICIGLAPKSIKLNKFCGQYKSAYAYDCSGTIWENGGKLKHRNRHNSECVGRAFVGKRVPLWGIGDVVGCGLNLTTRQLIFTKNGERIDVSNLFVTDSVELYLCVTLYQSGDKIHANFGPAFEYNFEENN